MTQTVSIRLDDDLTALRDYFARDNRPGHGTPYTLTYLPEADRITLRRAFHRAQRWGDER